MTVCAGTIIFGILGGISLVISVLQFMEKGFLFNNAFIWASEQERKTMNKKPHYRQSAIVFAFLAAVFFLMALEYLLLTGWLWFIVGALALVMLVYAIASSLREITK